MVWLVRYGDWLMDPTLLMVIVLGGSTVHFLLAYLILHRSKGTLHEMLKKRKHPYRFTFLLALGYSTGMTTAYLVQHYFAPSPIEIIGIAIFCAFALITIFVINYGMRLWNFEKRIGNLERP